MNKVESRHTHPLLSGLPAAQAKKGKVITAEEAVRVIRDGDTVATGGFVGAGFAMKVQSTSCPGRPVKNIFSETG